MFWLPRPRWQCVISVTRDRLTTDEDRDDLSGGCNCRLRPFEVDDLPVEAELMEGAAEGFLDASTASAAPPAFRGSKPAARISRSTVVAAVASSVALEEHSFGLTVCACGEGVGRQGAEQGFT